MHLYICEIFFNYKHTILIMETLLKLCVIKYRTDETSYRGEYEFQNLICLFSFPFSNIFKIYINYNVVIIKKYLA